MRSLITGGTGFVGRHLIRKLENPVVLSRNPEKARQIPGVTDTFAWNIDELPHAESFEGIDCIFHLAGESVFKGRWNTAKKIRIRDSRIHGTRNLVQRLSTLEQPPKTLICASAIGYYGSRGDEELTEISHPGTDFLSTVCMAWEEEAHKATTFGARVVQVRIGVVLGSDGGALKQMLLPFKICMGGRLGNGHQYMSWIHIDDLVELLLHAAMTQDLHGPINGVSPHPVTNREFTKTLATAVNRPAFFPVPGSILRLVLGEFASVLLDSQRVLPEKTMQHGYTFIYPELNQALRSLINP